MGWLWDDQNTFLTGKLYLYRAFGKIGDHACVMLDRHVFFPPNPPPTSLLRTFTFQPEVPEAPYIHAGYRTHPGLKNK